MNNNTNINNACICTQIEFEVLTAVSTKMTVFWVVAQCSLVVVYQRVGGPCCLHHQGDETRLHGATTQKTAIFICTQIYTTHDRMCCDTGLLNSSGPPRRKVLEVKLLSVVSSGNAESGRTRETVCQSYLQGGQSVDYCRKYGE
jgi:hypothetical protein